VGILTRGGGWGVITADACAETDNVFQALQTIEKIPPEEVERIKAQSVAEGRQFVTGISELIAQGGKPVLLVGRWVASKERDTRLHMLAEPEEAARVMAKMVEYAEYLRG
jgi:hypothetical protein